MMMMMMMLMLMMMMVMTMIINWSFQIWRLSWEQRRRFLHERFKESSVVTATVLNEDTENQNLNLCHVEPSIQRTDPWKSPLKRCFFVVSLVLYFVGLHPAVF